MVRVNEIVPDEVSLPVMISPSLAEMLAGLLGAGGAL